MSELDCLRLILAYRLRVKRITSIPVTDDMHILFSALGYKPAYRLGGPIASVAATAESLVRLGHRVTVFTTNGNLDVDLDVPVNQPVDVNGVDVWYFQRQSLIPWPLRHFFGGKRSVGFLYAPQMSGALNEVAGSVDIVHTQNPFIYPTLLAGKTAIRHSIPFFYQQRGALGSKHLKIRRFKKALYVYAIERKLLRSATGLIALTETEVEAYRALGVSTPCHVIPNGIDCDIYRARPIAPLPQSWNLSPEHLVILFLGRLHHSKGVDRLVDAFLRISSRFPMARLVLAGPDESGVLASLRQKAAGAQVQDQIIFPGLVTGEDKLNLLARANLFCLPSLAEGFSMSILEALASETPVLISPECNFPEVESCGVGNVVPSEADAIAKKLQELLADRQRLAAMGRDGRQYVKRDFDIDTVTSKLVHLYEESLNETRSHMLAGAA